MGNDYTNQLDREIKKLQANDYTSYQNFYAETSQYLYGVIWNNVNDQAAADTLINELYTEIYASIGNELTDTSQFYAWAEAKAKNLSTTYIEKHGLPNIKRAGDVGTAAATVANSIADAVYNLGGTPVASYSATDANVGIGTASAGTANAGIGTASAGTANAAGSNMGAGMDAMNWSNASAGTANAAGSNMGAGMDAMNWSNASAGAENGMNGYVGGTGSAGATAGNAGASGAAAATAGLGIGAKIAIGVAIAAVVVGGTIGIISATKDKDKDDKTETTTIEATTEETISTATDATETDAAAPADTEETTEETIDPEIAARSKAYYDMLVEADGSMKVKPDVETEGNEINTELYYDNIKLVDFNGDGKKQLVVIDDTNNIVTVYDYVNDAVTPILEADYTNEQHYIVAEAMIQSEVAVKTNADGTSALFVCDPDDSGSVMEYTYENGSMNGTEQLAAGDDYLDCKNDNLDGNGDEAIDRMASDGASNEHTWISLDIGDNVDYVEIMTKYDNILEELVTNAGIDTSNVWKSVYDIKLQQLQADSNSTDYSFALEDVNGDGIPELFGTFHGWDGGSNFMMTCSKYGTYDYISLARSLDISVGYNYINTANGYIHLQQISLQDDYVELERTYLIENGIFKMTGDYETYYSNDVEEEYWNWVDYAHEYDGKEYYVTITKEEYEARAEKCAGTTDIEDILQFVDTMDEITSLIENY